MKGIFWDVDGTLADTYRLGYDSTNVVLQNHGYDPVSEEEYHQGTKYTTPRRFSWHVTRGDPDNLEIGEKLGQEFDNLYVQLVSVETASFYPGMKELLVRLVQSSPEIRYAALSNACTDYVSSVLQVNGCTESFSVALGADKVPAAKPNPDGLLLICNELELEPSQCIFIGDGPTDGKAATAAGMKSIGVTWGSHSTEVLQPHFTYLVSSIEELERILLDLLHRKRWRLIAATGIEEFWNKHRKDIATLNYYSRVLVVLRVLRLHCLQTISSLIALFSSCNRLSLLICDLLKSFARSHLRLGNG